MLARTESDGIDDSRGYTCIIRYRFIFQDHTYIYFDFG